MNKIIHYICKFYKKSKSSNLNRHSLSMKKHLFQIVLFLAGMTLFTSCLKDDPGSNETVYYEYQHIPNINEFMPQRLLEAFGDEYLNYGDEPPKIEGSFEASNLNLYKKVIGENSAYMIELGPLVYTAYFNIMEQHKGIAQVEFKAPHGDPAHPEYGGYFCEFSSNDSTYHYIKDDISRFTNDSIAPSYFKNGTYTKDDFQTAYIMGTDPYFTIYFYEIRSISSRTQPLNAVIISGRMDEETITVNDSTFVQPVIKDLRWGIETMKYYKEGSVLEQLLRFGYLPNPGDVLVIHNTQDTHVGEFNY